MYSLIFIIFLFSSLHLFLHFFFIFKSFLLVSLPCLKNLKAGFMTIPRSWVTVRKKVLSVHRAGNLKSGKWLLIKDAHRKIHGKLENQSQLAHPFMKWNTPWPTILTEPRSSWFRECLSQKWIRWGSWKTVDIDLWSPLMSIHMCTPIHAMQWMELFSYSTNDHIYLNNK